MLRNLIVNFNEPMVYVDIVLAVVFAVVSCILVCRKMNRLFVYLFFIVTGIILVVSYICELQLLMTVDEMVIAGGLILFFNINHSEYRYLVLRNTTLKSKKDKIKMATTQDMYKMVAETVKSFSRTKTGALITFEKTSPLDNVMKSGSMINAPVSSELLQTIFYPGTRLHDGAVVIRGNMIVAAAVFYPPTTKALTGKYGSRHRAAVGISEISDSVTVVVSEETGRISLAYKARLESTTLDTFLDDLQDLMNDKE